MPLGNWIVERGRTTGGGAGGGDNVPAPPVTIGETLGGVEYITEVREVDKGQMEIKVWWTKAASATAENFTGVTAYLEDPDTSSTPPATMDGNAVTLGGTIQMGGEWKPEIISDFTKSPIDFRIPGWTQGHDIRVYLVSYNDTMVAPLVRAYDTGPTPNKQIWVDEAKNAYIVGQEYAAFITNPQVTVVEDFENVDGPKFKMKYDYTPPDPDGQMLVPGHKKFAGVQIYFLYPTENDRMAEEVFLSVDHLLPWESGTYTAKNIDFWVLFASVNVDNEINTPLFDTTPKVHVTLVLTNPGDPPSPAISALVLSNSRHEWQPDGTIWALADLTWKPPDSIRYAEVRFYLTKTVPPHDPPVKPRLLGTGGSRMSFFTLYVNDYPKVAEVWSIAAIGVDVNGKENDNPEALHAYTPTVTWTIGPPGTGGQGKEYTPQITISAAVDVTTEEQLNGDGIQMMRHTFKGWVNSTDNSFGGVSIARVVADQDPNNTVTPTVWFNAPKNATTYTSNWEPAPMAVSWDFYFVARDQQDRRNTIVMGWPAAGTTPKVRKNYVPTPGQLLTSRMPRDWFNEAEFEWPAGDAGKFQAENFVAEKIYVGSILRVGGGTGSLKSSFVGKDAVGVAGVNGQIAVYNAGNQLRAWMGEQKSQAVPPEPGGVPDTHDIYGGWFKELYVGGDNPTNAPLYCKANGVVIVGGFDTATTPFPYISVRDEFGTERGRIGSKIWQGYGLVLGDLAYGLAGAWFQEMALGGNSLADWRILARRSAGDPAGGNQIYMRNISQFIIDYPANYGNAAGIDAHPNAACKLLFGWDAYIADNTVSTTYKFPGIVMSRTGTSHSAVLINRGLVLHYPTGGTPTLPTLVNPLRAAALVTYNGFNSGVDSGTGTYWATLTMYSGTTGLINVELASGSSGNGNPFFRMLNTSNQLVFEVSQAGQISAPGAFITPISCTSSGSFGGLLRADTYYYMGSNLFVQLDGNNKLMIGYSGGFASCIEFMGAVRYWSYQQAPWEGSPSWSQGQSGSFVVKIGTADILVKVKGGIIVAIG